jgi:large subunit ribosomal protein L22
MSDRTFRAVLRNCPVTPRKARYVVDLIRGKPVNEALDVLKFCPRRAAPMLSKLVFSALASAQQDPDCDHNRLHVVDVRSDTGMTQKRWTPRSRGQMYPLLMRYSHLTVVLGEREPAERRERGGVDRSRRARVAASRAAQKAPEPAQDDAADEAASAAATEGEA